VREAMGPHDILLSDVGAHKMWVARNYHCDEPNTCLIPNGFCSMGSALPGAISAKMLYPDRRVMALCGDGGFLMNVQELELATRLGTNIVCMIWQDNDYGLITWKQRAHFGRNTDCSFGNPDFVKLAESFNCRGIRVERSRDLADALQDAFASDRPCLVVVPIDYRENAKLGERFEHGLCPIGGRPCRRSALRATQVANVSLGPLTPPRD
jgi:acetolactate synthase I/II/III large subunit